MLAHGGLAATYPQTELADPDLVPFRRAIDRLLAAHEPYPGFVVDRHWNMVAANDATGRFLGEVLERNTVRLVLGPLRPLIENHAEVTRDLLDRVGADLLRYPGDEVLEDLHEHIRAVVDERRRPATSPPSRVICPRFNLDGSVVRTITVAARFESVADVTLDEVRVELLYPEDDASERYFRALARRGPSAEAADGSRP